MLIHFNRMLEAIARSLDPHEPSYAITISANIFHLFAIRDPSRNTVKRFVRMFFGYMAAAGFKELEQFPSGVFIDLPGAVAIVIERGEKRIERFGREGPHCFGKSHYFELSIRL